MLRELLKRLLLPADRRAGAATQERYTVRGFDVTNFQVDGIGLPLMYGVRDGDVDEVAAPIVWLLSREASFVSGAPIDYSNNFNLPGITGPARSL